MRPFNWTPIAVTVILITILEYANSKSLSEQIEELQKSDERLTFSTANNGSSGEIDENLSSSLELVYSPDTKNGSDESVEQISMSSSREDPLQRILPKVKFDCRGLKEGYYPDTDFDCEVFHYCKTNGFRFTFVCPPKQRFNQRHMTCDFDPPGMKTCGKSLVSDLTNNSEQSMDYIGLQSNNVTKKESTDDKERGAIQEPSLSSSNGEKTNVKTSYERIKDPHAEYASSSQNWDSKNIAPQPSSLVDSKSLMQYMKEVSEYKKNSFREPEMIKNDRSNVTPNLRVLSMKITSNAPSDFLSSLGDAVQIDGLNSGGFKPMQKNTRNKQGNNKMQSTSQVRPLNNANYAASASSHYEVINANNTSLFSHQSEDNFKPIYKDSKNKVKKGERKSIAVKTAQSSPETLSSTTPISVQTVDINLLNHQLSTSLKSSNNLGTHIKESQNTQQNDENAIANQLQNFYQLMEKSVQQSQNANKQTPATNFVHQNSINSFARLPSTPQQQQQQIVPQMHQFNSAYNQYNVLRNVQQPQQTQPQLSPQQSQTVQHYKMPQSQYNLNSITAKGNNGVSMNDKKYPDYFFGLPKLSPKTNTPQFNSAIKQLQAAASGQIGHPFTSDINTILPKNLNPGSTYRLPIGRKPQATLAESIKHSWFSRPQSIQSMSSNYVTAPSQKMYSYLEPMQAAQSAPVSSRIPFLSSITKLFRSLTAPAYSQFSTQNQNAFPQHDRISSGLPINAEDIQNIHSILNEDVIHFNQPLSLNTRKSSPEYLFTNGASYSWPEFDQSAPMLSHWPPLTNKRQQEVSKFRLRNVFKSKPKKRGKRSAIMPRFPGVMSPLFEPVAYSDLLKSSSVYQTSLSAPVSAVTPIGPGYGPPLVYPLTASSYSQPTMNPSVSLGTKMELFKRGRLEAPLYRDKMFAEPYIEHIAFSDDHYNDFNPDFFDNKFASPNKLSKPLFKEHHNEYTPVVFKRPSSKRPPNRPKVPIEFKDGKISITLRPTPKPEASYPRETQFDDTPYSFERYYDEPLDFDFPEDDLRPIPKAPERSRQRSVEPNYFPPRSQKHRNNYISPSRKPSKQNYNKHVHRPQVIKSVDRPIERPIDRPRERPIDRPVERPIDVPRERPIEIPAERPIERHPIHRHPIERPAVRPIEPIVDERPIRRPTEPMIDERPRRPIEPIIDENPNIKVEEETPNPVYVPAKEVKPIPPYERPHPSEDTESLTRNHNYNNNNDRLVHTYVSHDLDNEFGTNNGPSNGMSGEFKKQEYTTSHVDRTPSSSPKPYIPEDIDIPYVQNHKIESPRQYDNVPHLSTSHPVTSEKSTEVFERKPMYEMNFTPMLPNHQRPANEVVNTYHDDLGESSSAPHEPKVPETPPVPKNTKVSLFKRPRPDFTKIAYKYKPSSAYSKPSIHTVGSSTTTTTTAAPTTLHFDFTKHTLNAPTSTSTAATVSIKPKFTSFGERLKNRYKKPTISIKTSVSTSRSVVSSIATPVYNPQKTTVTTTTTTARSYTPYKPRTTPKPRVRYQGYSQMSSSTTTTTTTTVAPSTPYTWTGYYYHPSKVSELPTTENSLNSYSLTSHASNADEDEFEDDDNISDEDNKEKSTPTLTPPYKKVFSSSNGGSYQHSSSSKTLKLFDTKLRPNYASTHFTSTTTKEPESESPKQPESSSSAQS